MFMLSLRLGVGIREGSCMFRRGSVRVARRRGIGAKASTL
jgi:hypothetical protein